MNGLSANSDVDDLQLLPVWVCPAHGHIGTGEDGQLQVQTAVLNLKGTNGHSLILAICMMVAFLSTQITGRLFNILRSIVFKANKQILLFSEELSNTSMQFQAHWKLGAMSLPLGRDEKLWKPHFDTRTIPRNGKRPQHQGNFGKTSGKQC